MKFYLFLAVVWGSFLVNQAQNLRLRQALSQNDWLNDVDGDNIPGQAGVDYPVHATVPSGTKFRCSDYDYAGYFADVEADCQAYHVCFPDGRNASFLCVNGTVFHQRYFVCDWWFHFNCSHAPSLYDLNLFRKIPLPVLPPVQRKPFMRPPPPAKVDTVPSPVPQPRSNFVTQNPASPQRAPKELALEKPGNKKKKDKNEALNEKKFNRGTDSPHRSNHDRKSHFTNGTNSKGDQCFCDCNADNLSPTIIYV